MMRRSAVGVSLALASLATGVSGQMSPGARSVAMGGAGLVFPYGVDAIEWNPANLGWHQGWNVSVMELGVASVAAGATVDEVLAIFGSDALGAADVNVSQAIAGLPASGIRFSAVSEGFATSRGLAAGDLPQPGSPLPSIGVAVGSFGLRIRSRVMAEATLSPELADLIGNGYVAENLQNYAVGNTSWRSAAFSEITASYGGMIGSFFSIGVGARYVQGHNLVDGRLLEPQIDLNTETLSISSIAVEAPGGSGFGLDVGIAMDLPSGLRVAASGSNLIQRMTWDDAVLAHDATYTDADFDGASSLAFTDLISRFDSTPVEANSVSLGVYEAASELFEQSYFPQVFRAGVGWRRGGTTIEAAGIAVAPRGRFTSDWDERFSLGVEQKIPILTLRAGVSRGQDGLGQYTGGVALGLGPVVIEASGGRFSGEETLLTAEGFHATVAIQIVGGGS